MHTRMANTVSSAYVIRMYVYVHEVLVHILCVDPSVVVLVILTDGRRSKSSFVDFMYAFVSTLPFIGFRS